MLPAGRFLLAIAVGGTSALSVLSVVQVAQADPDARPGVVAERPRDAAVHAVDGEVRTIAQVGGSVVMGGNFTKVGPVTRGAVGVVDTAGADLPARLPRRRRFGQRRGARRGRRVVPRRLVLLRRWAGAREPGPGRLHRRGHRFAPQPNGPGPGLDRHRPGGGVFAAGASPPWPVSAANGVARLGPGGGLVWGGCGHRRRGASRSPCRATGPGSTSAATSTRSWQRHPPGWPRSTPPPVPSTRPSCRAPSTWPSTTWSCKARRAAAGRLVHQGERHHPQPAGQRGRHDRRARVAQRQHQQLRPRHRARRAGNTVYVAGTVLATSAARPATSWPASTCRPGGSDRAEPHRTSPATWPR